MLTLLSVLAFAAPQQVPHQGRLLDASGAPVDGTRALTFRLWDAPSGGNQLFSEDLSVPVQDGYYSVELGATPGNRVDDADLAANELWLEVSFTGGSVLSRTRLGSVPYSRNGGGQFTTTAKSANYTILAAEASGANAFTNGGATGTITFTLPPAAPGRKVTLLRSAPQTIRIVPDTGDTIEGATLYELRTSYGGTTLYAVDNTVWIQGEGDATSDTGALAAGVVFTTCGQTGRFGPSAAQCATEYASVPAIRDRVSVTAGIQTWTAPVAGTYRIEAWGAEGGGRIYSGSHCTGGLGGYASGDITLTAGQAIKILVGQKGGSIDDHITRGQGDGLGLNGAGGGGSFVATNANLPLIVAGGGGGRHPDQAGCADGTIHGGHAGYGTTQGGGVQQDGDSGAGGGGFSSNGAGDWGEQHNNDPGRSFVNGGQGGEANQGQVGGCCSYTYYQTVEQASGGFGGGGGTRYWSSSSGGGGYHGGKGWNTVEGAATNSGGSNYVSGVNTSSLPGLRTGHGQVKITLLP
jgi:hypothetical protein